MVPPEWTGERRERLMKTLVERYGVGTVVMNDVTPVQHAPISELTGKRPFCVSPHPLMADEDIDYIAESVAAAVNEALTKESES